MNLDEHIDTDRAIDLERRGIFLLYCYDCIHFIKVNHHFSTSVSKVHSCMGSRLIDNCLLWEGLVHSILTHHFLIHLNIYISLIHANLKIFSCTQGRLLCGTSLVLADIRR